MDIASIEIESCQGDDLVFEGIVLVFSGTIHQIFRVVGHGRENSTEGY